MEIHPIITDHSVLTSLAWSVAGHTMDTAVDFNDNTLNNVGLAEGDDMDITGGTGTWSTSGNISGALLTGTDLDINMAGGSGFETTENTLFPPANIVVPELKGTGDLGTFSIPNNLYIRGTGAAASLFFSDSTADTVNGKTAQIIYTHATDDLAFKLATGGYTFDASVEVTDKTKLTAIGGYAIKLTNTTGVVTVQGQTVKADPTTNDAVILTAADDTECIGVFLDAGIADDAEAWVVVAGIADVAMGDNEATTAGNWVETNAGEAGYADATAGTPAAAPQHFNEIGHCIETVAAGGGGTHILARCVLHFL